MQAIMTNEEFKKTLWDTADKLRGSVSAATYKYPVLGLVFLKYVSDMYDAQSLVIRTRLAEPKSDYYIDDPATRAESEQAFIGDKTFYDLDNVFWVPPDAHFSVLLAQATAPDLAQRLDKAMAAIEAENPRLKGVLYREFSRLELEPGKLGELMGLVARLKFDPTRHGSRDVFGEVYEYFLGQFAMKEGARAGEFYTPKNVVSLLVEILAPFKGKIYDPACGSGGMFVQSAKFKDANQKTLGKKGDLAIYGQELMAQTRRLCLMNRVNDVFATLGLGRPDISLLDEDFLKQIREMPTKNLAAELLERLIADQIKARGQRNAMQGKEFTEKLEEAIAKYQNRGLTTVEVIEELIRLAKEINAARPPDGMTEAEFAFYQALIENESAVREMGHPALRALAQELTDKLRKSATINWQNRSSSRAKMVAMVKVLLAKYRYPPDRQPDATDKVITQAELLADTWALDEEREAA